MSRARAEFTSKNGWSLAIVASESPGRRGSRRAPLRHAALRGSREPEFVRTVRSPAGSCARRVWITSCAGYCDAEIQNLWASERSEEHTSELQSRGHLVCRPLLEKQKMHRGEAA